MHNNPGFPTNPEYQQQPYMPSPPPQRPIKKAWFKRTLHMPMWLFIIILVVVAGVGAGIGSSNSSTSASTSNNTTASSAPTATTKPTTPTPTPTPTPPPTWQTTHTFTGNGDSKTATFTVSGNDWKLNWSCNPSSNYIGQYNVIVDVDNSDTTPMDPAAINTICKSGNTSGGTEEHQGGTFYLDVQSEDAWTMTIQELK